MYCFQKTRFDNENTDDINVVKRPNIATASEELHPQEDSSTSVFQSCDECIPIVSVEEIEKRSDIELASDSMQLGVEVTSIEGQESRVKQKRWRPAHISQIDMEHGFDTPRRAKRHFNLAASKILSYKRQIASINRQKLRMTKKVKHLQSLMKELADKKMISEEAEITIQVFLLSIFCTKKDPKDFDESPSDFTFLCRQ